MNSELETLIKPVHSAVLLIDIQNDWCHPEGNWARSGHDVSMAQKATQNTIEFIKQARKNKVPIIFIKANHSEWTDSPAQLRRRKSRGVEICKEGTWGEQFYMVQPLLGDPIIVKHRYSAFIGTDLDMILGSRGITTLIVCGGGTHACVESTVRDGFMLDYEIVIVSDCCRSSDLEQHISALKRMADLCGVVVEAREVLEAWA